MLLSAEASAKAEARASSPHLTLHDAPMIKEGALQRMQPTLHLELCGLEARAPTKNTAK
jgi:hypothetical protein